MLVSQAGETAGSIGIYSGHLRIRDFSPRRREISIAAPTSLAAIPVYGARGKFVVQAFALHDPFVGVRRACERNIGA